MKYHCPVLISAVESGWLKADRDKILLLRKRRTRLETQMSRTTLKRAFSRRFWRAASLSVSSPNLRSSNCAKINSLKASCCEDKFARCL